MEYKCKSKGKCKSLKNPRGAVKICCNTRLGFSQAGAESWFCLRGKILKIVKRKSVDDSHLTSVIPDPILRQILACRGVHCAADLDSSLNGLLPPSTLQDIDKASEIIADAIMQQQRVLIAGDYDIDGMSGTSLGVRCLRAFGLPEDHISYYVPSRYDNGYGLNKEVVERAQQCEVNLIVTVDNGIAAFEAVDYAKELGLKVVITDHHEVQNKIPNADAVVDPKRPDDKFGSKNLCGVGVLFYVMIAVRSTLVARGYYSSMAQAPNMSQFLDLVTLGTIGDVMPLDSNNRRLVKAGLKRIHKGQCIKGVLALLAHIKQDPQKLKIRSIAFDLCPRYNAATRIKIKQNPAIMNLLCDDDNLAMLYAKQLDMCNKRRMDHEKDMLNRALELYQSYLEDKEAPVADSNLEVADDLPALKAFDDGEDIEANAAALATSQGKTPKTVAGIVLFDPEFMSGLVGLVANRIKERYHKPCVVFGADIGTGIDGGVDLMAVIDNMPTSVDKDKDKDKSKDHVSMGSAANDGQNPEMKAENPSVSVAKAKLQHLDPEMRIVGSARSVEGIDLMQVLNYIKEKAPDIFLSCGGHAVAAGASIRYKDLERFRQLFEESCALFAAEAAAADVDGTGSAYVSDCTLPDSHLCLPFAHDLELLEPWGKNFEEPTFDGIFTVEQASIVGSRHLKLTLKTEQNHRVEAIKFRANLKERALEQMGNVKVQVVYTIGIDRFFSRERLQLMVSAIEPV